MEIHILNSEGHRVSTQCKLLAIPVFKAGWNPRSVVLETTASPLPGTCLTILHDLTVKQLIQLLDRFGFTVLLLYSHGACGLANRMTPVWEAGGGHWPQGGRVDNL